MLSGDRLHIFAVVYAVWGPNGTIYSSNVEPPVFNSVTCNGRCWKSLRDRISLPYFFFQMCGEVRSGWDHRIHCNTFKISLSYSFWDFISLQIGGSARVVIFVTIDIRVYNVENVFKLLLNGGLLHNWKTMLVTISWEPACLYPFAYNSQDISAKMYYSHTSL
jgi:hypothetical protein